MEYLINNKFVQIAVILSTPILLAVFVNMWLTVSKQAYLIKAVELKLDLNEEVDSGMDHEIISNRKSIVNLQILVAKKCP